MRAVACVLLVGCSFHTQAASGSGDVDASAGTVDAPGASATCRARATDMFAGKHYFATANSLAWIGAQHDCASSGGHLVKITSAAENDFVTTTFASASGAGYTWIGLHDDSSGMYVWADGSALTGYTAWSSQQPPPGMCVDSNGKWDGYGCDNTNHGGACSCE